MFFHLGVRGETHQCMTTKMISELLDCYAFIFKLSYLDKCQGHDIVYLSIESVSRCLLALKQGGI